MLAIPEAISSNPRSSRRRAAAAMIDVITARETSKVRGRLVAGGSSIRTVGSAALCRAEPATDQGLRGQAEFELAFYLCRRERR